MALNPSKSRWLFDDEKSRSGLLAFLRFAPFRDPIRQFTYELANRSITPQTVVLQNQILTSDTAIDIGSATKTRV